MNLRVLVVDDTIMYRKVVGDILGAMPGVEVVGTANNGKIALTRIASLRPDLITLDVEMPVMDGVTAAGRLRDVVPGAKIIMLTVVDDDEHLLGAVRLGVHGYLLKDLHPDELFAMIRAAMRDESPVAPSLIGKLLGALRDTTTPTPAPVAEEAALSVRELEVLRLVSDGLSNKEIGVTLSITEGTVKNHVHNALTKLGMDNRIQAAAYIVRAGLGTPRA